MAPRHAGLPRPAMTVLDKTAILDLLQEIDQTDVSRQRVLELETSFRDIRGSLRGQ